jgi:hypothetical protein
MIFEVFSPKKLANNFASQYHWLVKKWIVTYLGFLEPPENLAEIAENIDHNIGLRDSSAGKLNFKWNMLSKNSKIKCRKTYLPVE